jgi:hypothetical protein
VAATVTVALLLFSFPFL